MFWFPFIKTRSSITNTKPALYRRSYQSSVRSNRAWSMAENETLYVFKKAVLQEEMDALICRFGK